MVSSEEFFRCDRTSTTLTRNACGKRWRRSGARGWPGDVRKELYQVTCKGCSIGKAHARGDAPDVRVVDMIRRAA